MMTRLTVAEVAAKVGATLVGDGAPVIEGVAPLSAITPGSIVFADKERDVPLALESAAAAAVASVAPEGALRPAVLVTPHVRRTFADICQLLFPGYPREAEGVHPTAFVDPTAAIGPGAMVGPYVAVGPGCRVGARATIRAGVVLDEGAEVGDDCYLFPGVVVGRRSVIGPRTIVHPNAVIGGEGFGFAEGDVGNTKQPQFGRVVVGADCEIGACTTIDRGTLGDTVLGDDVKVDNLVQIAHNCRVGSHVRISALSGLAGGAVVEDGCVFGGQSGVGNRVTVRRGTLVGAQAAVLADTEPGAKVWGTPAQDLRKALKESVLIRRLPELLARLRALERRGR